MLKRKEEPHEEAEILRKALRQEKNLALSGDTCVANERMRSDLKKSLSRIEAERGVEQGKAGLKISLLGISRKEASNFLGLRRRHRSTLHSIQGFLCSLRIGGHRGEVEKMAMPST